MVTDIIDSSYPVEGPSVVEAGSVHANDGGLTGCQSGAGDSDGFPAVCKSYDVSHPRSTIMDASSTSMCGYDSPSSTPREDECPSSGRSVDKTFALPVHSQIVEESSWSRCLSSDGYEYFVNDVTGESVWELPPGGVVCNTGNVPDTPVLAYDTHGRPYYWTESTGTWVYARDSDWTMSFDERYMCHYFVNSVTGDSSWEHPMWSARAAEHSASSTTDVAAIDDRRKQLARRKAGTRGRVAWQEAVAHTGGYGDSCSDADTSGSDSGSDSDEDDVDEILQQLGEVDGAVVGLTLAQRARWTRKKLAQVTGSVMSNLSTAAQSMLEVLEHICWFSPICVVLPRRYRVQCIAVADQGVTSIASREGTRGKLVFPTQYTRIACQ
jgi:hypothetical protein